MSLAENEALDASIDLVRRYVDALNTGDLAVLDELFADDFVIHQPPAPAGARARFATSWPAVRRLLPDIDARVDAIFADDAFKDGHRVGVLLSYEATNAQLGRRVSVRELQLFRVLDGQITEGWYATEPGDHFPFCGIHQDRGREVPGRGRRAQESLRRIATRHSRARVSRTPSSSRAFAASAG